MVLYAFQLGPCKGNSFKMPTYTKNFENVISLRPEKFPLKKLDFIHVTVATVVYLLT